jgi:nucleoside-diphosphate-sugar epimerase
MRVILTGANGFIGKNLLERLLIEDYFVGVIVRRTKKTQIRSGFNNERLVVHEYHTQRKLINFFSGFEPDVVVHLAGSYVSRHKSYDIKKMIDDNILFGNRILEALSFTKNRKFINTGTSWQHYYSDEYNPVNLYAASKQAFQDILKYYVEAKKIKAITLKLFESYGPKDNRNKIVNLLIKNIGRSTPLKLTPGEQLINLVHVDDIVEAFMTAINLILKNSEMNITQYAVSANKSISIKSLVKLIERLSGENLNVNFGGEKYRDREVFIPWTSYEILPGWKPRVNLENGLKKILIDYK